MSRRKKPPPVDREQDAVEWARIDCEKTSRSATALTPSKGATAFEHGATALEQCASPGASSDRPVESKPAFGGVPLAKGDDRGSRERHGPQAPARNLHGLARLRAAMNLSPDVSMDDVCDDATTELETLRGQSAKPTRWTHFWRR